VKAWSKSRFEIGMSFLTLFDTIGLNVYPVMSLKITGTGLYRRSQKDDFPGGPEAGTRT
jgi:hypothetical protein